MKFFYTELIILFFFTGCIVYPHKYYKYTSGLPDFTGFPESVDRIAYADYFIGDVYVTLTVAGIDRPSKKIWEDAPYKLLFVGIGIGKNYEKLIVSEVEIESSLGKTYVYQPLPMECLFGEPFFEAQDKEWYCYSGNVVKGKPIPQFYFSVIDAEVIKINALVTIVYSDGRESLKWMAFELTPHIKWELIDSYIRTL